VDPAGRACCRGKLAKQRASGIKTIVGPGREWGQGQACKAAGERVATGGPGRECRAVKQRATGAAQVDPVKATPGNDRWEWSSRYASGSSAQWSLAGWLGGCLIRNLLLNRQAAEKV